MSILSCRMIVWSRSAHLAQIQTGLSLLAREGAIRLTQQIVPLPTPSRDLPVHLRRAHESHMRLVIDDALTLYIDAHDSWELDAQGLAQCELYFKRSFVPERIPADVQQRVHPLGLNYEVYTDGVDPFAAARSAIGSAHPALVRFLARLGQSRVARALRLGPRPRRFHVGNLFAPPMPAQEPRVLFMARVWDPAELSSRGDFAGAEDRQRVNEMRAECIVRLRRELGDRFLGGLQPTDFARKQFPDALLQDGRLSDKARYLQLLRHFPICIATAGLHGSIGWKLAEYVAFSKAIVSEPLRCTVPGDFRAGRNYLEFETPDECVAQAVRLISDDALRSSLMMSSWTYYLSHLRPDVLACRVLERALRYRTGTAAGATAIAA